MGGKLEDLSELSKSLAIPPNHPRPEEYIRETLLAHGFFGHARQSTGLVSGNTVGASDHKLAGGGISDIDKKRTTQLVSHIREGREVHSLKEPQNLFARLPARQPVKKLPLWPSEVECMSNQPCFVSTPTSKREPFHHDDHEVVSPKIRSGEGGGTLVYTNLPSKQKYFICSRAGPSIPASSATPTRAPDDITLIFESRFESGNLGRAVQVGKWDYELYLRFDLYTNKHTQWFYFCVENMRAGQTYRFTIVNLYKAGSLYNNGMQPVMYSVVRAKQEGIGWGRAGHAIKYFKTDIRRQDTKQESYYYGLTWSHTFQHSNDTVYFAHCYPYTYSDLQLYLHAIQKDETKSQFVKQRTLCHTIAGNSVPILTITSMVQSPEENRSKRVVVLTARVHPGETNGSWMMKGLLDFLISNSPDAKILRDTFIFKVIPMLNPDGVIVGNYRCSLSGRDLNRNYRSKLKDSYPTIWHTKAMVKKMSESNEVVLYCDFHGHSRKQNIFIYGCDQLDDPLMRLRSRVFPKMLSKNSATLFSYKDSKFGVHKSKEGTGRVVMWREMGITNSYTVEATFCGSLLGKMAGYQFSTSDLEAMGYHFCDTLLDYCDPDQSKVERILEELSEEYRLAVLAHLASVGQEVPPGMDPLELDLSDFNIDLDSSDGGSDSSMSDGLPVHVLARETRKKKKKKLKSRRERNKKKAMLKMTHVVSKVVAPPPVPPTTQAMATSAFITQHVPIEQPLILSYHHDNTTNQKNLAEFSYMPNDVARNGGIPVFIQERIDERQKKRSDAESAERFSDEHHQMERLRVEAMTMDYMRQGVPPTLPEVDPQISASSLMPRPHNAGFPMSITPIPLWDGRGQSHPPSKLSSKTALPQLDSTHFVSHSRGSIVPFTSQYLAHHVQTTEAGLTDLSGGHQSTISNSALANLVPMTLGQNSTKNLANLSRLFRQLKPHLLQNIGSHMKSSQNQLTAQVGQLEAEPSLREVASRFRPNATDSKSDISQPKDFSVSGLPVQAGGASRPLGPTHPHAILMKQLQNKLTAKRSETTRSSEHLSSSEKISPSNSQFTEVQSKKGSSRRKSQPTRHDRKVLADIFPSSSFLSSCKGSPLTSSWESFTRPVKLTERHREEEEEEVEEVKGDANILLAGKQEEQWSEGDGNSDTALRQEQSKESHYLSVAARSSGVPDYNLAPPSGAEVETHKLRIAKAVDDIRGMRHQRQLQTISDILIKETHTGSQSHGKKEIKRTNIRNHQFPVSHGKGTKTSTGDPYPSLLPTLSPSPPSLTTSPPPHPPLPNGGSVPVMVSVAEPTATSSDEEMRRRLEGLDVDLIKEDAPTNQWQRLPQRTSSTKRSVPVSTSYIYSSKPPSNYGGPKPTPDCSSRPTTVSLMLSRRGRDESPSVHAHLPPPKQWVQSKHHPISSSQATKRRQFKGQRKGLS